MRSVTTTHAFVTPYYSHAALHKAAMIELMPLLSLVLYSILMIAALAKNLTGTGSSFNCKRRRGGRRASLLLLLLAVSRLTWSTALLVGASSRWQLVVSAVADAVANASFYAWIASLALRSLPTSTGAGDFGTTLWRAGKWLALVTRVLLTAWLLVVVVLSSAELYCLLESDVEAHQEVPDAPVAGSGLRANAHCATSGEAERIGLAVLSLTAMSGLWMLYLRVLRLHKELSAPIGTPSRALLAALAACAFCMLGRAATLLLESVASDVEGSGAELAAVAGCSIASAACLHLEGTAARAVVTAFAYWLPELGTPLILYVLSRYAASLHRKRSGHGGGSARTSERPALGRASGPQHASPCPRQRRRWFEVRTTAPACRPGEQQQQRRRWRRWPRQR